MSASATSKAKVRACAMTWKAVPRRKSSAISSPDAMAFTAFHARHFPQFRRGADAPRPPVPGGRCRAYRAADRCEGPEPRGERRVLPRRGNCRSLPEGRRGGARGLFRSRAVTRLEGAAFLVVDDVDAAS